MAKKRVSLTLEEELVEKIDSEAEADGLNRSQMVENIVELYFRDRSLDTAVVLCGDPEAKSLEKYQGRTVLEYIIDQLSEQSISRAILLIGRNEEIEDEFGAEHKGVSLEYVREEEPRGTAAALRNVEKVVDGGFVVLNGHVMSDVDLHEMLESHREQESVATIALTTVEDPSSYGVARLKGRKILGFEEKPSKGEEPSRLINAGTYVLEPEIFDYTDEDSLEDVFEKLASLRKLSGYIYGGKWMDVDE